MHPARLASLRTCLAASLPFVLATGCNSKPAPQATTAASQAERGAPEPQAKLLDRAPNNGYGSQISWRTLEQARATSKASGKSMMVFVHASWCGRCKELRPIFDDPELIAASDSLVMVNLDHDEHEEARTKFAPDGNYVPRILFIDPSGEQISDLVNPKSPQFPLYYSFGSKPDLLAAMRRAGDDTPPLP